MGNAVQYEATVCVVQESMSWKGNQIRDNRYEKQKMNVQGRWICTACMNMKK